MSSSQLRAAAFTYYLASELRLSFATLGVFCASAAIREARRKHEVLKEMSNPRKLAQGVYKINFEDTVSYSNFTPDQSEYYCFLSLPGFLGNAKASVRGPRI